MKTILAFANANGLKLAAIRFKAHGKTSKGYALVKAYKVNTSPPTNEAYTGYEMITIEPCFYSNGDRWLIKQAGRGPYYAKNMKQVVKSLDTRFDTDSYLANIYASNEPFIN